MMIKGVLTTLLLITLVIALPDGANETLLTKTIEDTKCTFYYSNSNETGFTFHSCQRNNEDNSSWTACLKICCPDLNVNNYGPSLYALDRCIKGDSLSGGEKALIVMAAVGATVAIVFTCCFLIITFKCCKLYGFKGRGSISPVIIDSVQWTEEKHFNTKVERLKWSAQANEGCKFESQGQLCSICLEGRLESQLYCKHKYHAKCIGEWFKRSDCCPCCRKDDIRGVKVYCQGCRWRYMVCTKTLLKDAAHKLPQLCQHCSHEPKYQQKRKVSESGLTVVLDKSEVEFGKSGAIEAVAVDEIDN